MVKVITVLLKSFDQLAEQLLTLLIPQPQDMPKGIHDGVDAAQPVEIALAVSAPAPGHQLLFGAGKVSREGGGHPDDAALTSSEPLPRTVTGDAGEGLRALPLR